MLKQIPKSNIARRSFKVYKRFNVSESTNSPITASSEYNSENYPLYKSIQSKYYTDNGLINNFGTLNNPATFEQERYLPDTLYVLKLDQSKYGEGVKPESISMIDGGGVEILDDGFGSLVQEDPSYTIDSIDFENEILIISQSGVVYDIPLNPASGIGDVDTLNPAIDLQSGILKVLDNGVPENYTIISIDLESNVMILADSLDIAEIGLDKVEIGNIFYSEGLLVFNGETTDLTTFSLEYRSTTTIHETEILIEAKAGEFNYSQNPSAVNVVLSGSYDFTTTAIPNVSPAKTVKIKEVRDISQKTSYTGSIGSSVGTWDDYDTYRNIDPTGSYLAPYITTIGLYDKDGDMVAIAKLPTPIKNLPDYDMNFIVRFDT
jgi:hypothetical protein